MKVLITSPYTNTGGVAAFVTSILPEIHGNKVVFRRGKCEEKGKLWNLFLTLSLPFNFLFSLLYHNPTRVIVNTSLGNILIYRDGVLVFLSRLLRKKTLLIIHGFNENALSHKHILKWGYFKADAICVLADDFRRKIKATGYKREVYVQLNPVSTDILKEEMLSFPPVSKMLFIGRIELEKGVYITLDTYKMLKDRHPEMTLDLVGTGSEDKNVKEYIKSKKIDGVTIHGFKSGEGKKAILRSCGFMCFASYREGLPISVLEAMTVGQLIISRPVGGIVDLYKQCDFGKIVSSLEAKDFAMAYEELITDPIRVENIRRNNREFALKHFTPKAIVENIDRIFGEMN